MSNLSIVLIGYGRMGHEVELVALSKGHTIVAKIDNANDWISQSQYIETADMAIDFSIPSEAIQNMRRCLRLNLPLIVGTTGWYDHMKEIEEETQKKNGSILWASNFSLGVNIIFHFNEKLAEVMSRFPEYKPVIHEIHHTQKLDTPSGTAISLANGIIKNYQLLDSWKLEEDGQANTNQLAISHERVGQVPGTHEVSYESEIDRISLNHEAKNRKGFASGAILAAEWLLGKKGFFNMKDVLGF